MTTGERVETVDGPTEATEATDASDATQPTPETPLQRRDWVVFFGLGGLVLLADQASKAWLVSILAPKEALSVIGDTIRLVFSQNSGALFGLFRDNALLFGIISTGVIALIVVYRARSGRSLYLSIGLGLILGGALGNMTDRLRLGYVIDFVDIGFGGIRWYTFNLADAAITGAILMLLAAALIPSLVHLGERPADG